MTKKLKISVTNKEIFAWLEAGTGSLTISHGNTKTFIPIEPGFARRNIGWGVIRYRGGPLGLIERKSIDPKSGPKFQKGYKKFQDEVAKALKSERKVP